MSILCFNSNQLIGNGLTIPAGPLRESMSAIKKAQIIVINGNKDKLFEKRILTVSEKIKIFYSRYLPTNINQFKKKKILAFAGIGNPNNFFNLLRDNNLNVQKKVAFPDHYEFSKVEIQDMIATSREKNLELVTTEKDYFRIKKFGLKNIKYVKLKLHILKKEKLLSHILSYL
jgi:tetraacyldisaccharide 4'-kinase